MTLHGTLCRQDVPATPCHPVDLPGSETTFQAGARGRPGVVWTDTLPSALVSGPLRPIRYRVEIRNDQGKSAGPSGPVLAAAGTAPAPIQAFEAQGIRTGVLLRWAPVAGAGEVLIKREQLDLAATGIAKTNQAPARKPAHRGGKQPSTEIGREEPAHHANTNAPGVVWLQADPGNQSAENSIDGTVVEGTRYRYTAVRRLGTTVAGKPLEVRSRPSVSAEIAWHDVYPPAPPQGLTAIGFAAADAGGQAGELPGARTGKGVDASYAIDLVWQPVTDPRVTGYVVERVRLGQEGQAQGEAEALTPQPVATPAFHDATAKAGTSYRYEVRTVDTKGNRSAPATARVQANR